MQGRSFEMRSIDLSRHQGDLFPKTIKSRLAIIVPVDRNAILFLVDLETEKVDAMVWNLGPAEEISKRLIGENSAFFVHPVALRGEGGRTPPPPKDPKRDALIKAIENQIPSMKETQEKISRAAR
jgi:hypothetical protein